MEFIAFHLMPYGVPDAIEAIGASQPENAWVTFSNRHYDPKQGTELYRRYLDELTYAAELGFDGVSVNEHHQNAYGTMPNPNVMAAALIERVPGGASPCWETRSPCTTRSRSSSRSPCSMCSPAAGWYPASCAGSGSNTRPSAETRTSPGPASTKRTT